jgi:hypothetical protein
MALLIIGIVLLVIAGLTVGFGIGWLAIIPALLALAALGWGATTVAAGRTPTSEVRRVKSPELLGPGGPDDPDR